MVEGKIPKGGDNGERRYAAKEVRLLLLEKELEERPACVYVC